MNFGRWLLLASGVQAFELCEDISSNNNDDRSGKLRQKAVWPSILQVASDPATRKSS
jgi:hypothetical protein